MKYQKQSSKHSLLPASKQIRM